MTPSWIGQRRQCALALGLPVVALTVLSGCSTDSGPDAAGTTSPAHVLTTDAGGATATGTVTCTDVTGGITFHPPLVKAGTSPESTSIVLTVSGCTTSGSTANQVASANATGVIRGANNSCTGLLTSMPITVTFAWSPNSIHPSAVAFSGFALPTDGAGHLGFALPDKGGTSRVAGSFGGGAGGASSSGSVHSPLTAAQLQATCDTSAGLTSVTFANGTVTLS